MKPNEAKWSQMKPNEAKWSKMKQNEANWSKMKQNEAKWAKMKQNKNAALYVIWAKLKNFDDFLKKWAIFVKIWRFLENWWKFMKMRKTPNKWVIGRGENGAQKSNPHVESDQKNSQKSQNALETGGVVIEKKRKNWKKRNNIVRIDQSPRGALYVSGLGPSPSPCGSVHGRSGLNALGQRFAARKSHWKKKKKKKKTRLS